jgi:hypothetical protein
MRLICTVLLWRWSLTHRQAYDDSRDSEVPCGVTVSRAYELKRLDLDYFSTEDEEVSAQPVYQLP